jgi:putative molybdopterin biosynthesis protein
MPNNESLSVQEVAELLGISKNTVYDLIKRNQIPSYRVGHKLRIDYQDIELYKAKSRSGTSQTFGNNSGILVGSYNIPPSVASSSKSDYSHKISANASSSFNNLIICGQDMLLDILASYLERPPYNLKALRSYTGSYNGLVELYKGNVSIASAHLWDAQTNSYNLPYLHSLLPGFSCYVVNLAYRMQGFYVAKGNPKGILAWEDLAKPNITMINRELGCGVRVLIDESIKLHGVSKQSIVGYHNNEFSHISVASAVARGDADVSVGNEKTSHQVENIDFVPIQKERLDLIIPKDVIHESTLGAVLEILNSAFFKSELLGIGGYDISDTGKIIAEI